MLVEDRRPGLDRFGLVRTAAAHLRCRICCHGTCEQLLESPANFKPVTKGMAEISLVNVGTPVQAFHKNENRLPDCCSHRGLIGLHAALNFKPSISIASMEGAQLIAAGIVIGLFASYAMTRFLASQIWGISVSDPWTFAAEATLIAFVGLAACCIPARRAARVDPIVASC